MAVDPQDGSLVLYGGDGAGTPGQGVALYDTWHWIKGAWDQEGGGVQPIVDNPAMVPDPAGHGVLLVGTENDPTGAVLPHVAVWLHRGGAWQRLTPAGALPVPLGSPQLVADPTHHRALLYGRRPVDPNPGAYGTDHLWSWDGAAWSEVWHSPDLTPAGTNPTVIGIGADGSLVGLGARGGTGFAARFTGSSWSGVAVAMAVPTVVAGAISVGGQLIAPGTGVGGWRTVGFDGSALQTYPSAPSPTRTQAALAVGEGGRPLLLGGVEADASGAILSPNHLLSDLWQWDGQRWAAIG